MTKIIPIRDLRNTAEISELCNSREEPIFVTKNGYGDLVIMSIKTYEKQMSKQNTYEKLLEDDLISIEINKNKK